MNRIRRRLRALPLLFCLTMVGLVPLASQAEAELRVLPAVAPAAPGPPEPEPSPETGPAPGPSPQEPQPDPSPGPRPEPDRPSPEPSPQEPSSPEPSPGEMPSACEADGDPSDCDTADVWGFGDLFDVPAMVTNAITMFLGTVIEQAMQPIREFLADTLLATPDVTQHADIKKLWQQMLTVTVGLYVLFVAFGGITVMGYETVQSRYALKQIAPRLLFGMVAAALSRTVMGKAIELSNALAHAIMATDMADAAQGMVERVLPFALFGPAGLKLYLLLLALMVVVLVVAVLIGFMVRVAVMALLAVLAPLALACHAHPVTDPIARLWWRGLAGCLVIQVAQSMTFILALKLFFAPGATALGIPKADQLGTLLAGLALFWALFKIPGWTLQVVLRGTPVHQPHAPGALRILRHLALYRLMEHYLPGMHLLRRGGGRRPGLGGGGAPFGPGGRRGPLGGGGRGGGGARPPRPSGGGRRQDGLSGRLGQFFGGHGQQRHGPGSHRPTAGPHATTPRAVTVPPAGTSRGGPAAGALRPGPNNRPTPDAPPPPRQPAARSGALGPTALASPRGRPRPAPPNPRPSPSAAPPRSSPWPTPADPVRETPPPPPGYRPPALTPPNPRPPEAQIPQTAVPESRTGPRPTGPVPARRPIPPAALRPQGRPMPLRLPMEPPRPPRPHPTRR
ncbi:hypothetical protein [Streptomyces sp. NPDC002851]